MWAWTASGATLPHRRGAGPRLHVVLEALHEVAPALDASLVDRAPGREPGVGEVEGRLARARRAQPVADPRPLPLGVVLLADAGPLDGLSGREAIDPEPHLHRPSPAAHGVEAEDRLIPDGVADLTVGGPPAALAGGGGDGLVDPGGRRGDVDAGRDALHGISSVRGAGLAASLVEPTPARGGGHGGRENRRSRASMAATMRARASGNSSRRG